MFPEKFAKCEKFFGSVLGAYYFQCQVCWGSWNEWGVLRKPVLQNKWSLSTVFVGFETFF